MTQTNDNIERLTSGSVAREETSRRRRPLRLAIPNPPAEAPAAPTSAGPPDITVEDLAEFAAHIGELIDDSRYRAIARRVEVDLHRAEAARRRIPPAKLRLAE
ncbi:MAG TPA: hypothetical protein VEA69_20275 [Tepidisphaeraceae bacterium]|nr:hypothetical protein [Tepidisphaeraceae bacterium]